MTIAKSKAAPLNLNQIDIAKLGYVRDKLKDLCNIDKSFGVMCDMIDNARFKGELLERRVIKSAINIMNKYIEMESKGSDPAEMARRDLIGRRQKESPNEKVVTRYQKLELYNSGIDALELLLKQKELFKPEASRLIISNDMSEKLFAAAASIGPLKFVDESFSMVRNKINDTKENGATLDKKIITGALNSLAKIWKNEKDKTSRIATNCDDASLKLHELLKEISLFKLDHRVKG